MSAMSASDRIFPEDHFRRLFEEAPLPYQALDVEGRLVEVNQAWERLLGYKREDALGHFMRDFLVPGQEEKQSRAFQAFLHCGTIEGEAFELRCHDGTHKLVALNGRVARDAEGRVTRTHCILNDITERTRIENALKASEEKYRLAMEATQVGLWDWNIQTGHAYYSPRWSRILGAQDSHTHYSVWEERIHPADRSRTLESLRAHLAGATTEWAAEHRLRHDDGSWIWVLGRGRVVERDPSGKPLRMVGTMTDIQERKIVEIALRESEERYRLLLNSADELISVFDRNGVCRLLNQRAASFFGGAADQVVGKSFKDLHPAFADQYTRRIRQVIDCGNAREYEDHVEFPGGPRWLLSRVYPMSTDEGITETALIISQDVTDRRLTEEALRESEAKLKALINATTDDVVVLLDAELRMEIVNERAARGFGRTVEQMIGCSLGDFMPPSIARSRREYARRVIGSGIGLRFEDQRAGRWYDNNMCPVFDRKGRTRAVAIFARDITERKIMEEELAQAKDKAEKASVAKSRFLAAANHDLRQPLHALRLLIEALSLYRLESPASEVVLDMKNALKSMEGLLNALLDISKLEAGSFQPKEQSFRVLPFLYQLRGQFKATAQDAQKHIRVVSSNAVLRTDPVLLGRILQNFMSNAIRHARGGSILIGCRRAGHHRRIEVWDNGPGIPKQEQQRIFDEFYQLGNPARNADQGLGLGLSIAKRMADLLNLKIGLRSTLGKGSVFFIEVPTHEESGNIIEPQLGVAAQPNNGHGVILVVDDDELVLNATKKLLDSMGHEAIFASTAVEAIDLAMQTGTKLRLALVDYRLPDGWDGIQLTNRLRTALDRELPVILITGDTAVKHLRQVQTSNLPLLHKPIDPEELRNLIDAPSMHSAAH